VTFNKATTREQLHDHLRQIGVDDPATDEPRLIQQNLGGAAAKLAFTLREVGIWKSSQHWDTGLSTSDKTGHAE
jgi:hypothetical protein